MRRARRSGFTLVEGLIAAAIGAVVLGGGMLMYLQGNKMFQQTTEHSSTREEALLILERLAKDLDALMVSDEVDPETGRYYMLQPYKLTGPVKQVGVDANGQQKTYTRYTGIQFFNYHHTESMDVRGLAVPRLVGQMIEYKLEPINGDAKKFGNNLMRNGVKINKIPLQAVFFDKADPIRAKNNIGAAPDAVLDVYVVSKGGMWGTLAPDIVDRLLTAGHALMRTYHLVGYESQFTAILSLTDAKLRYGLEQPDELEMAVYNYAREQNILEGVAKKTADAPLEYRLPSGRVTLQRVLFDPKTAGDKEFASAKSAPGDPEQAKIQGTSIRLSAGSQSSRLNL